MSDVKLGYPTTEQILGLDEVSLEEARRELEEEARERALQWQDCKEAVQAAKDRVRAAHVRYVQTGYGSAGWELVMLDVVEASAYLMSALDRLEREQGGGAQ